MRQHSGLRARSQATDIPLKKLITTTEQLQKIEALYEQNIPETHQFFVAGPNATDSQIEAACLMASLGVDIDGRDDPSSRWNTRWSSAAARHIESKDTRRVLYQCDCGYDHVAAGSQTRHVPVPFTECLAHVEVTYMVHTEQILRIRGFFDHNDACKAAVFTRIPPVPIHPAVYRVALAQLAQGVPMKDVREANQRLVQSHGYPEMPRDPRDWKHRWVLESRDSCSLYRQFSRLNGVKTSHKPHLNIHAWLDPESKEYNPVLADAMFHYSARAAADERFEACIATNDMKAMAWKYGHQSQILLDGTFGLCDSKLLLFILMGIDEDGHGVPLAFLFFSAPSGNKHTAAGYDTKILAKLLRLWVASVEQYRNGETFRPYVAVTDTDMKERGALLQVFPWIVLLICRVHLRRSWKNHRNKTIKGKAAVYAEIRNQLHRLEDALERILLEASALVDTSYNSGLVHLDYLENYWLQSQELWESWAEFGRHRAASVLCCSPDKVVITTNHLESFNNVLKNQSYPPKTARWPSLANLINGGWNGQSGSAIKRGFYHWPGGDQLWQEKQTGRPSNQPLMFLAVDEGRDKLARELVLHKQISAPTLLPGETGLSFTCYSSVATELDEEPVIYTILLSFNGLGSCSCPDFSYRGGACKHIRAALIIIDQLRAERGIQIPAICLPSTEVDARRLHSNLVLQGVQLGDNQPIAASAHRLTDILGGPKLDGVGIEIETEQDEIDGSEEESECEDDNDDDELSLSVPSLQTITSSSQAGLQDQAVARTLHDLRRIAPALGDLATLLRDTGATLPLSDVPEASILCSHLLTFTSQLSAMIASSSTPSSSATVAVDSATVPSVSASSGPSKLSAGDILPPSPEKMQKRHESYSVH
ncbi:hypothetical protein BDZ89DRAFT_1112078 [Hymenopellis radicata]|nr:hypothetical protein BDZ89DRAFT_1112078 [Hymenopellis radicata]